MNRAQITLSQVGDGLRREGLLTEDVDYDSYIENLADVQPWYIRTMVGFGAWIASLLIIGFFASVGFATDSGFAIVGGILIVVAIFIRRLSENDFLVQSMLASSLAGQALLAYGITEASGGGDFENILLIVIALNVMLFFVFPDYIHRVLSILIAMSSISVLLYIWEFNAVVPVIGPLAATAMMYFYNHQGGFIESLKGHLIAPLVTGLMFTSFGFLMLSTVYVLPELRLGIDFYPRPWISTLLLSALLIYLGKQVSSQIFAVAGTSGNTAFYALLAMISVAAWAIPGLLLALIVIILGVSSGNRIFIGAGIAFLVVFIATYFYGIQISMLTKSVTLISTGITVLLSRWLFLKIIAGETKEGENHA